MLKNLELAAMNLRGLSLTEKVALARLPRPADFIDRMIARTDEALASSPDREPVCSVSR